MEKALAKNITFVINNYENYCRENRHTPNYKFKPKD